MEVFAAVSPWPRLRWGGGGAGSGMPGGKGRPSSFLTMEK